MKIMTSTIIQIFELCSSYFKRDDADVNRDKLFVLNYALSLSDRDFASMLNEIYAIVDKYQSKPITENSHIRNLYLMSMPSGGEQNGNCNISGKRLRQQGYGKRALGNPFPP